MLPGVEKVAQQNTGGYARTMRGAGVSKALRQAESDFCENPEIKEGVLLE
jgi:hypothetical protein